VLTCKSLFGLGYRGERLIEPSFGGSHAVKVWLVGSWVSTLLLARPSNCLNVLLIPAVPLGL
jgi:hypothetical protein